MMGKAEVLPTMGGLGHTAPQCCPVGPPCCQTHSPSSALCSALVLSSTAHTEILGSPSPVHRQNCLGPANGAKYLEVETTGPAWELQGQPRLCCTSLQGRVGWWQWQWVMARACVDSSGGKQEIALGKEEEEGGLLCSTAEKGTEAVDDTGGGGLGCL